MTFTYRPTCISDTYFTILSISHLLIYSFDQFTCFQDIIKLDFFKMFRQFILSVNNIFPWHITKRFIVKILLLLTVYCALFVVSFIFTLGVLFWL